MINIIDVVQKPSSQPIIGLNIGIIVGIIILLSLVIITITSSNRN